MKTRTKIASLTAFLSLSLMAGLALPSAGGEHLQPSSASQRFNSASYVSFADYVIKQRVSILANRSFFGVESKEAEMEKVAPFALNPQGTCQTAQPRRGIVLVHGLSDTAFAMQDLAKAFAERCFTVRAVLLPGHGTRAGDLLKVSHQDWQKAVDFALEGLKGQVEELYVGGFSLGGLLATHAAVKDKDIKGAFAFSPALSVGREWQIKQSTWLRHFVDWADTDVADDYVRYEAMPLNAIAQTYLLTKEFEQAIDKAKTQKQPMPALFLAQSADDGVIDGAQNALYFSNAFFHPASRMLIYQRQPLAATDKQDHRIRYINSDLPDRKILGFSHQAIHISEDNPHYGRFGDYRSCGANADRAADQVALCSSAKDPWRGEVFGLDAASRKAYPDMARLTFNPLFDEMFVEIDEFLSRLP